MLELDPYAEKQIADPKWHETGRVHDWRNYVPNDVQQVWEDLPPVAKRIAFKMAERWAANEDWD